MEQLIKDAIERIRNSEELGRGSCSTVDECQTNDELAEEIRGIIVVCPNATVDVIFEEVLSREQTFRAYEADIQGA